MSVQSGMLSSDLPGENKYQPWIVCFSAAFYFFFEFMQMVIPNAMGGHLMKEFNLTADQLGGLTSMYFLGNVLFLFPAGIIIDRVSTRKLILITLSVCVIGTFGFAMATNLLVAKICRFCVGVGGAFCFLSNVRLASRWFPPERLALVIGLIVTIAMLGGTIAQSFASIADALTWRKAFLINAMIGLLVLIIIFIFVRDYPKGMAQDYHKQHDALQAMGFWVALKKSFGNIQNWLGGIYTSFMNLPIMALGAVWGNLYLVQVHHLSRVDASWVSSMIFFGSVIGSPFWGWYSDRIGLRKKPMIFAAVMSILTVLIIMFVPGLNFAAFIVLFFALGFFTIAQIISYPLIAESNPKALTATSESIASVLIQSGGFSQVVFGFLMELHWNHTIVNGDRIYAASDYLLAMCMFPVVFLVALLAAVRVRETHCRSVDE